MKLLLARNPVDYDSRPVRRSRSCIRNVINASVIIYLFTILLVTVTQTGCGGVRSALSTSSRIPFKNPSTSLMNTEAGIQFQASLNAIGGVQPYNWSIASGALPPG